MKVNAKYREHLLTSTGASRLVLEVNNYQHQKYLNELENDIDYIVEIKKVKSKRSLQANSYMWALLHQLELKTREPAMDWYIKALIDTGAKCDYLVAPKGSKDILMKSYRAVQAICKRLIVNPVEQKETEGIMYRCFIGSSKMTIAEMNELIETIIRYCLEYDIQTERGLYE